MRKRITIILCAILLCTNITKNKIIATEHEFYAVNCWVDISNGHIEEQTDKFNTINGSIGENKSFRFYYDDELIDLNDSNVTFTGNSGMTYNLDPNTAKTNKIFVINFNDVSTGSISYKGETIDLRCSFPHFALYTSNEIRKDSLITKLVQIDPDTMSAYLFVNPYDGETNISIKEVNCDIATYNDGLLTFSSYPNDFCTISVNYTSSFTTDDGFVEQINIFDSGSNYEEITINNKTYKIGLCFNNGGDDTDNIQFANSFGNDFADTDIYKFDYDITMFIGIMDEDGNPIRDQNIYDLITNVKYTILTNNYSNNPPDLTTIFDYEVGGIKTTAYNMNAKFGNAFKLRGIVTYSINNKRYGQTFSNFYKQNGDLVLDYNGDLTNLNNILSSMSNFNNYLIYYYGDEESVPDYLDSKISLKLPATAVYEGDIVVSIDPKEVSWHNGIELLGTVDGNNKTTIKGSIKVQSGLEFIRNITFDNSDNTRNGTIAITSNGNHDQIIDYYTDVNNINNCDFINYEYGIKSDEYSYLGSINECYFKNCTYAYYLDSNSKIDGASNDENEYNIFDNCFHAVTIKSLPSYVTPYSLKFFDNYFLNVTNDGKNDFKDFVVNIDGDFYFLYNYYGSKYNDFKTGTDLIRSSRIQNTGNGNVISNPCIRYLNESVIYGLDPTNNVKSRFLIGFTRPINPADFYLAAKKGIPVYYKNKQLGIWLSGGIQQ